MAAMFVALGGALLAFAGAPSTNLVHELPHACVCRGILPLPGESEAAAQKRQMSAELRRLIARYVAEPKLRLQLQYDARFSPEIVVHHAALKGANFSDADRACYKRVTNHYDC